MREIVIAEVIVLMSFFTMLLLAFDRRTEDRSPPSPVEIVQTCEEQLPNVLAFLREQRPYWVKLGGTERLVEIHRVLAECSDPRLSEFEKQSTLARSPDAAWYDRLFGR